MSNSSSLHHLFLSNDSHPLADLQLLAADDAVNDDYDDDNDYDDEYDDDDNDDDDDGVKIMMMMIIPTSV